MNLEGRAQNYSKTGPNGGPVFEGMAEQHVAATGYRYIVADHRRQYPYQVKLANAGEWRDRPCSPKAREIVSGPPGPMVRGRAVNLLIQDCRASRRLQGLVGELWHRLERAGERAATGDAANDAARGSDAWHGAPAV